AEQDPDAFDDAWVTELHGGARLVPFQEPGVSDTRWTFRAYGDSTFTRYRRVRLGGVWVWEARTLDGKVYRFGEKAYAPGASPERAPLTSITDRFGGSVIYRWNARVLLAGDRKALSQELTAIEYTA